MTDEKKFEDDLKWQLTFLSDDSFDFDNFMDTMRRLKLFRKKRTTTKKRKRSLPLE